MLFTKLENLFLAALIGIGCGHTSPAETDSAKQTAANVREGLELVYQGRLEAAAAVASTLQRAEDHVGSAQVRLAIASVTRDADALAALESDAGHLLRQTPMQSLRLARARFEILGPSAAQSDYAALCKNEAGLDAADRDTACARARLGDYAANTRVLIEEVGETAFLPNQPIPIVTLSVNGNDAAAFIVDTGAPTTVLTAWYADQIGFEYETTVHETARDGGGGAVKLFPAQLSSIALGQAEVESPVVNVMELPPNFKVGGILSPRFSFPGQPVTFDFEEDKLLVGEASFSQSENAHRVPLYWSEGNPYIEVAIDDTTGLFLLDTGAAATMICERFARKLGLADALMQQESAEGTAAASKVKVWPGFPLSTSVGGDVASPEQLMVHACPTSNDDSALLGKDGYLGLPWMRDRVLSMSADRRELIFTSKKEPSLSGHESD